MPKWCLGKQLLAVFLLIFMAVPTPAARASSHIAQLRFITEPQSVSAGQLSQELIIQAQDTEDSPVEVGETIDLEFTSTSLGGEFLNASGNPVSTVMNKNWKSRTFYYRDSAAGTHNLKVKATGRVSGKSWEAAQGITIFSGESDPPQRAEPSGAVAAEPQADGPSPPPPAETEMPPVITPAPSQAEIPPVAISPLPSGGSSSATSSSANPPPPAGVQGIESSMAAASVTPSVRAVVPAGSRSEHGSGESGSGSVLE